MKYFGVPTRAGSRMHAPVTLFVKSIVGGFIVTRCTVKRYLIYGANTFTCSVAGKFQIQFTRPGIRTSKRHPKKYYYFFRRPRAVSRSPRGASLPRFVLPLGDESRGRAAVCTRWCFFIYRHPQAITAQSETISEAIALFDPTPT